MVDTASRATNGTLETDAEAAQSVTVGAFSGMWEQYIAGEVRGRQSEARYGIVALGQRASCPLQEYSSDCMRRVLSWGEYDRAYGRVVVCMSSRAGGSLDVGAWRDWDYLIVAKSSLILRVAVGSLDGVTFLLDWCRRTEYSV
ncbi:hypothetical protein Tco_0361059 [Tanacetum coccineum]